MKWHEFISGIDESTPELPASIYPEIEKKALRPARHKRRLLRVAASLIFMAGIAAALLVVRTPPQETAAFAAETSSIEDTGSDEGSSQAVYNELAHISNYFDSDSMAGEITLYSLVSYSLNP